MFNITYLCYRTNSLISKTNSLSFLSLEALMYPRVCKCSSACYWRRYAVFDDYKFLKLTLCMFNVVKQSYPSFDNFFSKTHSILFTSTFTLLKQIEIKVLTNFESHFRTLISVWGNLTLKLTKFITYRWFKSFLSMHNKFTLRCLLSFIINH